MNIKKIIIKSVPPLKKVIDERETYYISSNNYYQLLEQKKIAYEQLVNDNRLLENSIRTLTCQNENLTKQNSTLSEEKTYLLKEKSIFEEKYELLLQDKNNLLNNVESLSAINEELSQENIKLKQQEKKMLEISSSEFWDSHYKDGFTSGTGSYDHLAEFKATIINEFVESHRIESVIEFGCGDGNQLSLMNYPVYVGVDVSETIIKKNKDKFADYDNRAFFHRGEKNNYMNKKYDLALSLDVIFHLVEDTVYIEYMKDLFKASSKYVIIYSSNHEEFTRWPEFRNRKFMKYVQENESDWKLVDFVANKYPFELGNEDMTSPSDFYIFEKM
ncbi:class I SAM-dependent methyltransferase [Paenibacillus sp. NRS-1782]|uniref:class I SAM-dependent methyltransferase n=1 Tax=unclassified Paenibacillus TaxID=185978 RepID=UPI003D2747E6